jgi:AcrR family transcriptional regulator
MFDPLPAKSDIDITFANVMIAEHEGRASVVTAQPAQAVVKDPPTRKGQATRERLLTAAEHVFGRHGYEKTRIADIVAEAGISHGLFYRHFADKDAVLNAVLTRLNDRLRHSSGRTSGEALVPTLEQLQARNILFFREYAEHRLLLRVSREAAALSGKDGFRAQWLANRQRFVARTQRWIELLVAEGHVGSVGDAATLAEALSALTEQMAYVSVGLAEADPMPDEIERMGKACGLVWHRSLFGIAG